MIPRQVKNSNSFLSIVALTALWLVSVVTTGCATNKDVDALRAEVNNQIATVRSDTAQTRQAVDTVKADAAQTRQTVETMKADVIQLKSLGVAVDSLKSRLDNVQSTVQALHTEGETQRLTLLHEFQMEVTLARERIKVMEQLIEDLQEAAPAPRGQERGKTPRN